MTLSKGNIIFRNYEFEIAVMDFREMDFLSLLGTGRPPGSSSDVGPGDCRGRGPEVRNFDEVPGGIPKVYSCSTHCIKHIQ